jgi:hypothetical protein
VRIKLVRVMKPQSFEDFIRKGRTKPPGEGENPTQEFELQGCPTPGCGCGQLHLEWDDDMFIGFRCDFGCVYKAKRNAFTGDLMYYQLIECDVTRIPNSSDVKGIKFNPLGEPYTDWY